MRNTCISAVEFFTRLWTYSPKTVTWVKKHYPTASMSEFYATCDNVSLLWWALGKCILLRDQDTKTAPRAEQLVRALHAFRLEFYHVLFMEVAYAEDYLTKADHKFWSNRLREYVTPR